jgi:hypothetical protein
MQVQTKSLSTDPRGKRLSTFLGPAPSWPEDAPSGRFYAEFDSDTPISRESQFVFFAQFLRASQCWERFLQNCPLIQFIHSSRKKAPGRSVCLCGVTLDQSTNGQGPSEWNTPRAPYSMRSPRSPDHSTPSCRSDLPRCPTTASSGSTLDCAAAALKPSPSVAATHVPRVSEMRLRPGPQCDTPPHHWPQFA